MTREECIGLLKRYAEYDGMGIPKLAGCKEAMRMAAELLERPSLPSNLDEAAEEELDDVDANWQIDERDDGCIEPGYNQKQMLLMFKAGAEWMAGQGETMEGEVVATSTNDWESIRIFKKLHFVGDKVVVQIRKK